MSLENDDDSSIKPKEREFVFLLAIAGRIDAQSKIMAQHLDKDRTIYHLYNIFDSLSSSYSMFKYFFEVCISSTNDPDLMRRVLSSPQGVAAFTGEAVFLVAFSFLAGYFEKEKEQSAFKYYTVTLWPYFRDAMKGFKNAYKGWKSATQIIGVIGGSDLKHLIIPVGLVLGAIATVNRIIQRVIEDRRKHKKNINNDVLKVINGLHSLSRKEHEDYLNGIKTHDAIEVFKKLKPMECQEWWERALDLVVRGLGGLIDSLYLYAGVIGLAVLSPEVFLVMAIISVIYSLACVTARVYEGLDAQKELSATHTRCKLALVSKELETTYGLFKNQLNTGTHDELKQDVIRLIRKFEELRQQLKDETNHTYLTSFLLGIKNGLFAYGVLTSCLFMVISVFGVSATVFPPALLIAIICSGLALIIGVTASMMHAHYHAMKKQKSDEEEPFYRIIQLKETIENANELLQVDVFKQLLHDGRNPQGTEKSYTQEWLEVFRSFFSGISKGNNFAGLIALPFLQPEPQDHEHGSSVMLMLSIASAAVFSIILALRALTRGLGKDTSAKNKATPVGENKLIGTHKTEELRESSKSPADAPPDSLKRNLSFQSIYTFFKKPPKPDINISSVTEQEPIPAHTVVGLT